MNDLGSKLFGLDRVARDGEAKLEWDFMPDAWVLALLIVPIAAALAFFLYRSERKDVGWGPKILLSGFRTLLLLFVLFMVFGPKLAVYSIEREWAYVVVLIDASSSMSKSDPPLTPEDQLRLARVTGISPDDVLDEGELNRVKALTRAGIVRGVFDNKDLHIPEDLESKLNVKYYAFASRPTAFTRREDLFGNYQPDGKETAIGEAMRQALQREHSVVAVIVVSDFRNNAGVDPEEVARQLRQRYIPVYTVLPGIPRLPRNITLLEPEGSPAVLAGDEYKLDFKIRSSGYEGQETAVGVWSVPRKKEDKTTPSDPEAIEAQIRELRPALDHPIRLAGKDEKQIESVVLRFEKPGDYFVILKLEPREGESTRHDNYLVHPLRVADDKIKVLYVEHPPRYEYRFLKNALIRDPKILCHILLTSADPDFPQEHTKNSDDPMFKEPLKEFPKTREQLFQYDVLILGDMDPGRLGGEEVWENIEAFVTEFGGGLILISGYDNPRLFLDKPAMKKLVPVEIDESRPEASDLIYDRHYGYALTAEAKGKDDRAHHPIVLYKQFAKEPEKNLEHWEDRDKRGDGQVGIRKFLRTKGLAPQAGALVEVTGTQGDTKRPPLFVVQYNGSGRVFWSGTDETWLWRYLVGDYPYFYPFWQQAMYWVRQGKLLGAKRYQVRVDKKRYNMGQEVKIYATAYDEKFHKSTKPELTIFVEPPEGKRESLTLKKDSTRDGYYEGSFTPNLVGNYRVWAGEDDEATRAEARFSVDIPTREDENPELNQGLFERVAGASHQVRKGRPQHYELSRVHELAGDVKASEHILRKPHPPRYLWASPAVWIFFALLITLEWIFRKVWRML